MIEFIVKLVLKIFGFDVSKKDDREYAKKRTYSYSKKSIMTFTEKKFYNMFQSIVGEQYVVLPQINLATIIKKNGKYRYQSELYRNIDFGIFSKETFELLLLIEINDESHNRASRRKRDITVDKLCNQVGYPIIKFWLNKPNEYEYVKSRILEHLHVSVPQSVNNLQPTAGNNQGTTSTNYPEPKW